MNRAVLLVAICAAIVGVSYGMHSPVVPVFARDELGADYSQVGLIGMVKTVAAENVRRGSPLGPVRQRRW